jgi:hypothetical protein
LESEVKHCKQKELQALDELEKIKKENQAISEKLADTREKLKMSKRGGSNNQLTSS